MLPNVIICTLIMWSLTMIAVIPLSKRLFAGAVAGDPALSSAANSDIVYSETTLKMQKLQNVKFVQADVLVMGIAGFVAGLSGVSSHWFRMEGKCLAWPSDHDRCEFP